FLARESKAALLALVEAASFFDPAHCVAGDVSTILENVKAYLRRYVVLTEHQAVAETLWVAHTHAMDAAECTPYLNISGPTRRTGKTRNLEVLQFIVARPWLTQRTSAAVLVRKTDHERPTLLLDETDSAFNGDRDYAEALRGLLNSGYRRS